MYSKPNNQSNNQPWHSNNGLVAAVIIAAIGVLIGITLIGWAGLRAVTNVFADGLPELGILVIQVVVAVMGVVVSVVIGLLLASCIYWLTTKVLKRVTRRMDELESDYKKQLNQLRGRAPTFVAGTALLGQAALVLIDKSFGEDRLWVILISVLFIISFGFANTLMLRSSWKSWSAGCVAWVLTFCSVPLVIMGYYSWNVLELSNNVLQMLSTDRQAVLIASGIIVSVILFLIVLPLYSLYMFLDRKESPEPTDAVSD